MADRPNIIVIISDDHGTADRSVLGIHPDVSTPCLDRLAAEGVTCEQAYSAAPICSPSRAALMTGRSPLSFGTTWFDDSHLPEDGATLAERLGRLGYATAHIGKVHYGPELPGDRGCPPNHGFDESFYGLAGQSLGRLHYLTHSAKAVQEYGEAASRHGVQPLYDGTEETETDTFLTFEFGQRSRDFISRHAGEPFFLSLAFNAVHNFGWQLPDEELVKRGLPPFPDWDPAEADYLDWYDGVIRPNLPHGRQYYLAQLELMDAEIGRILDHLDGLGLTDDTVVVYLADHGGSPCNYGDNTPLQGAKYTLWEGGIRIPYIVRWPGGGIPGGVVNRGMISQIDLYATLLSAAGAEPATWADTHGLDQLPLLRGERAEGHSTLHWDNGFQYAVRSGDWKLRYVDRSSELAETICRVEHVETGSGFGLYNLLSDPGETRDLSSQHPAIADRLQRLHLDWRARMTG